MKVGILKIEWDEHRDIREQINEVSGEQVQHRIVDAMLERIRRKPCCGWWQDIAA